MAPTPRKHSFSEYEQIWRVWKSGDTERLKQVCRGPKGVFNGLLLYRVRVHYGELPPPPKRRPKL